MEDPPPWCDFTFESLTANGNEIALLRNFTERLAHIADNARRGHGADGHYWGIRNHLLPLMESNHADHAIDR